MIDQVFLYLFLSEILFLPHFRRSKQRNNRLQPLLAPPSLNFTAENRRLKIMK